jgi:hypothetical protein
MLCVTAPFFALGWCLQAGLEGEPSSFAQFQDLSGAHIVEIRTVGGEVAMTGELRDHTDALGNVEKDAALLGAQGRVIGEIEIEVPRPESSSPAQELEVDVISLRPSTTYRVFVNDRLAATFMTDDRGSVDLEFSSPGSAEAR